MATWTNLKTLGLINPLKALEKRNPSYFSRYQGLDDEFGYKLETFARWEPFFRFCYEDYFKVDCRGIENIPEQERAILVGNHSGLLPLDGAMITIAMCNAHKSPRRVRYLVTDWFTTLPGVGEWIQETGQVRATLENAQKLLAREELVGVYPEGLRGVGKAFPERYRLLDFHPGFVQLAISTQTKIIPVATVGGDEIFPNFVNLKGVGRLLKMPFFPVTTAFPWMPFPHMFIPLPVHWLINVHKPIDLGYPPEKANDRKLVLQIAREIQYDIQRDLNKLLRERKSLFTGWDPDDK
ncbi:MAG: acyltransferase family protein [Cyanobacteria bacterium SZAS-4]|nr:acyltransferase family protein [Cyanobacteria bacterium SZAS-4]